MAQVKLSTLLSDNRIGATFSRLFHLGLPSIACSVEKLKDLKFLLSCFLSLFPRHLYFYFFLYSAIFHLADSTLKSSSVP